MAQNTEVLEENLFKKNSNNVEKNKYMNKNSKNKNLHLSNNNQIEIKSAYVTKSYSSNKSKQNRRVLWRITKLGKLSERKIKEYSKSDLFIFNSLDEDRDRDYAVKMINYNSKLKVIDVSTGMD